MMVLGPGSQTKAAAARLDISSLNGDDSVLTVGFRQVALFAEAAFISVVSVVDGRAWKVPPS